MFIFSKKSSGVSSTQNWLWNASKIALYFLLCDMLRHGINPAETVRQTENPYRALHQTTVPNPYAAFFLRVQFPKMRVFFPAHAQRAMKFRIIFLTPHSRLHHRPPARHAGNDIFGSIFGAYQYQTAHPNHSSSLSRTGNHSSACPDLRGATPQNWSLGALLDTQYRRCRIPLLFIKVSASSGVFPLESLRFVPVSSSICGFFISCAVCACSAPSQPIARNGANVQEGCSHSSPRTTTVVPIKWSSTTWAK